MCMYMYMYSTCVVTYMICVHMLVACVTHVCSVIPTCTYMSTHVQASPRASPPPTAPKHPKQPRPPPSSAVESHSHMGSLRHTLGSPDSAHSAGGPETVLAETPGNMIGPAHGSHGGVSHKIQQLLNTLKRPRKNRRPVEEYYHDDEAPGEC